MLRPELQADLELLRDAGGIPGAGGEGGGRVARPMRADQQLLGGLQPPRDPPSTVRQPRDIVIYKATKKSSSEPEPDIVPPSAKTPDTTDCSKLVDAIFKPVFQLQKISSEIH